jgi:nucleoside phosphorylase
MARKERDKTMMRPLIIIAALKQEAAALAAAFGLRRFTETSPGYGPRCFAGDHRGRRIMLYQGGMGIAHAAAAVGFAAARHASISSTVQPSPAPIWLNVGSAGVADLALGSLVGARSVGYQPHDKRLLLDADFDGIATRHVLTVVESCADYPEQYVVEMEAFGFVEAALRFAKRSHIAVLKVITDNRQQPVTTLTRAAIATQIARANTAIVDQVVDWAAKRDREHERDETRECERTGEREGQP